MEETQSKTAALTKETFNPDLLTDSEIQSMLEQEAVNGLEDLYYFDKYILGYKDMEEEPHRELCDFMYPDRIPECEISDAKGYLKFSGKKKKLIEEPRGTFKSTVITVGYSLYRVTLDPNVRILIASEKLSNAQKFLSEIKGHMEGNDYFRTLYGEMDKKKNDVVWNDSEIIVADRTKNMKESTITTAGIDVTKVGMHYDVIIVDDPVSPSNTTSKEQIDKVFTWYKLLLSLLEPGGDLIIIGTRWDYGDLYGSLQEEPHKELFDILVRKAEWVDEAGAEKLLFPTRLTKDFLNEQKTIQGSYLYSCNYLNEPVSTENQTFKEEWFKKYMNNDIQNRYMNKFLCVDPAISESQQSDFTVFMVVGVDENNNLFILLIDRGKYTPAQIVDKFIDYATRFGTLDNGLETVAYQKSLRYYLNDKMREMGKFIKITELKSHTNQSKDVRIRALQPRYEMGSIFHKAGDTITADLEYELLHFPKGKHDDIIDTLASTLEIMYAPVKGQSQHKKKKKKSAKKYQSNAMKW